MTSTSPALARSSFPAWSGPRRRSSATSATSAVAVVGGIQVATGQITLGSIQAFIQYVRQFNQPLTQVAGMYNTLQSGVASAERVFDLLDAEEEPPEPAVPLPSLDGGPRGRVEFRARQLQLPARHTGDRRPVAGGRTGQHRGDRRADRRGQDDAGESADAVLRRRLRAAFSLTGWTSRRSAASRCAPASGWCCRTPGCSAARSTTTSPTAGRTPARTR